MPARTMGTPDFEGNEWEQFCRQALACRHGTNWQKIPSKNRGDWGLEGFVRGAGIVVQCYADDSISNMDRTRHQKGKLTADIPKLRKNSDVLRERLRMIVRQYDFLVPSFDDKDLLEHADRKAEMVRSWSLDWIADDFRITVQDLDSLHEEWLVLRGGVRALLGLDIDDATSDVPAGGELVETLERKLAGIPRLTNDPDGQRGWRTFMLDDYTHGSRLLTQLEDRSPQYADRITRLIGTREQRLARRSSAAEPLDDINALTDQLADAIHREIATIEDDHAQRMAGAVVADWLMRCPLEYVP